MAARVFGVVIWVSCLLEEVEPVLETWVWPGIRAYDREFLLARCSTDCLLLGVSLRVIADMYRFGQVRGAQVRGTR